MYESKRSQGFCLLSQGTGNLLQELKQKEKVGEDINEIIVKITDGFKHLNKLFIKIEKEDLTDSAIDDVLKLSNGFNLLEEEAYSIYQNKVEEKTNTKNK